MQKPLCFKFTHPIESWKPIFEVELSHYSGMTLCECCCQFSWSTSWPLLYIVFTAWIHFDGFGTTHRIHFWYGSNVVNFLHFILHAAQCSLLWDMGSRLFRALRGEHTLPDAEFELFIKPLQTLAGHVAYDFSDYRRWCSPQLFLFQVELDHQLEQWWRKGETFSTLLLEFQSRIVRCCCHFQFLGHTLTTCTIDFGMVRCGNCHPRKSTLRIVSSIFTFHQDLQYFSTRSI